MLVEIPEIVTEPVTLRAEEVLGPPRPPVVNRVSFGFLGPERITKATPGVGPEAGAMLTSTKKLHSYYLICFSCSFRPGNRPLRSARLTVSLTGNAREAPIAWSMQPDRKTKRTEQERWYEFSPKVKFVGASISLGTIGSRTEFESDESYLIATGLLESVPEWYFRATGADDLEGKEDLQLVVRVAAEDQVRGDVFLGAKVGGIGMKADLPSDFATFTLH
jgi:hypothetical protein